MSTTRRRPPGVERQAEEQAEQARETMDPSVQRPPAACRGGVVERAGEWDLEGMNEAFMQRQKFFWNPLMGVPEAGPQTR